MKEFKYCPEVKVGTVFERIDCNRKVWQARVVNRTEYFVDVEKIHPYKLKVVDDEFVEKKFYNGQIHKKVHRITHEEDAKPTYERAQIIEHYKEIKTGEFKEEQGLYGPYQKPVTKKVKLAYYTIHLKDDYTKHAKYDTVYKFEIPQPYDYTKTADYAIEQFYKYCEEN